MKVKKKALKFLNRRICWTREGITYEADEKHVKRILSILGLEQANGIGNPTFKPSKEEMDSKEALTESGSKMYRSVVATGNYLGVDRPDVQYHVKECSKSMAKPHTVGLAAIKKIARYLKSNARAVQHFRWQSLPEAFVAQSDSDWAGDQHKGSPPQEGQYSTAVTS